MEAHPTIVYDGECPFCRGAVDWIVKRAPEDHFLFAAAQSEVGAGLQERFGVDALAEGTLLLIEDGVVYRRSTAALKIAARLNGAWRASVVLRLVPRPLRDWVYKFIARRRSRS